ncbi:PilT protein domain protein [Methylobacterium sp. 4-46]|uniref:type II toxin-antitoxin system VapC family toxin n=1 Tax=unclassified Methylobacterium TaxID=2615210 RepID=UPI000152E9AF|nr:MULTISPECIES: type II toxin-antitoxin system VapC family toxin [Methylobacterium]ACA16432.1 PilT protein domain protein [Methylobacterium sp. 4-46]WFT82143.1 type II toxin-antitoxin system VapC family toxin [Methylobacterium nodulans]
MAEAESLRIEAWLRGPAITPVISDLVVLEFSATMSRLVRERRASADEARTDVELFGRWRKARGRPLVVTRRAFTVARGFVEQASLGLRGPDALHLALVEATGLPLATFDVRMRAAALALGLAVTEPPPL